MIVVEGRSKFIHFKRPLSCWSRDKRVSFRPATIASRDEQLGFHAIGILKGLDSEHRSPEI